MSGSEPIEVLMPTLVGSDAAVEEMLPIQDFKYWASAGKRKAAWLPSGKGGIRCKGGKFDDGLHGRQAAWRMQDVRIRNTL
ncbi:MULTISPECIES: hypothetical protein [unclassified Rhizobium]|uniref:hypothetical protein n=1 Tax=unclassified Rhizobium TaxID=2613769 RepID=UPI000A20FACE|nr:MULTISPECIES: hypothetical protein [unclassified Rhizobium]ARO24700.1 hypothetical protein TAL182_CH02954 [Rhizobium sp. TAL182]